jgi:hypothetical protein
VERLSKRSTAFLSFCGYLDVPAKSRAAAAFLFAAASIFRHLAYFVFYCSWIVYYIYEYLKQNDEKAE